MKQNRTILVTGGAGYVGAVLVPKLLAAGHRVRVLDLYIYGDDVLETVSDDPNLTVVLARTELGEKIINNAMRDGVIYLEDHPPLYIPKSGMGWESKEHAGIFRSRNRKRYGWPTPDFQYPLEICPMPGKIVFP